MPPECATKLLAERVVEHLEQSGFEIDEGEQVNEEASAEREPRLGRCCAFSACPISCRIGCNDR